MTRPSRPHVPSGSESEAVGCCDSCGGTGHAGYEPCSDCLGTGHPHAPDPTCGDSAEPDLSGGCGVSDEVEAVLVKIAAVLAELYEPAGVLMFWSARIKYLDDRRPCDLWRDRDMEALDMLWRRLEALADGAFA